MIGIASAQHGGNDRFDVDRATSPWTSAALRENSISRKKKTRNAHVFRYEVG
jgi:hypothetical protein